MSVDVGPRLIGIRAAGRMLRPVRGHLITCAVLSALGEAAGLAPYLAVAEIARSALTGSGGVLWWAVAGAAGAVLRLVLLALSSHLGHHADARMLHHLRRGLVRRLGVLPLGWFRTAGSGQIKKAMTDDLEDMHNLFAHSLGEILGAATAIGCGLGYLLLVDWRLALVTVLVPALALLCYRISMRSMPQHVARLITAEREVSAAAVEYGDGIAVAKTFGAGGRVLDRFHAAVREQQRAFRVWVDEVRYSSAFNRVLGSELTVLAVVLAVGLPLVAAKSLPAPDLLPFLVVGLVLPNAVLPMIHGGIGLRTARLAAGHIDALLTRPGLPEPAKPQRPQGHRIEFDRVSFSYDGVTNVLSDLSATCEPGTVTALVGPSGAGKSTLAALLPRFHEVTDGAIRIGGADIREIASADLLSLLGLVFQDVVLLRDTVTENIRIACPSATDAQVRAAAEAAQIHHVLAALPRGYDTVLDSGEGGLSGGERQRLTIARAILSEAPIVILDEATAALDPDSEAAVQDALSALVAGRTVLVIAHRLHTIATADQILVLDEGHLVERGDHHELLAQDGLYARLWRAQRNGGQA